MILREMPAVLHVALLAPMDRRIDTIIEREHLGREEAAAYVEAMEKAREEYFKKFFGVVPDDPALYHMVVNEGGMSTKTVAEIVAHAAKDLEAAMSERVG